MAASSHQDWNEVVLTKSSGYKGNNKKKSGGTSKSNNENSNSSSGSSKKKKIDEEQEDFRTAKIGKNFSVALQQARLKKNWKQQQLAQALNVRQTVINQYESGKAVPNPQLIAKMNRVLGTKLPPINKPGKPKKKKKPKTAST
mmetsp:Transcript_73604/g.117340  ORF Transcript_73604/g.117340 Transcript_73604/m.117340 type:complete len:143 (+) Transcript_73604:40-468(+)